MVLLLPIVGAPLPTFSDATFSVTVEVTRAPPATSDWPASGAVAAAGLYSSGLLTVKGKLEASASIPASFAVRLSGDDVEVGGAGREGPPTVALLFRLSLRDLSLPGAVRVVLAMTVG